MINLLRHHRLHIPNSLAIAAALVLVVSSVVGFEANLENSASARSSIQPANATHSETNSVGTAVESKSRSLNIGSLLFRRG